MQIGEEIKTNISEYIVENEPIKVNRFVVELNGVNFEDVSSFFFNNQEKIAFIKLRENVNSSFFKTFYEKLGSEDKMLNFQVDYLDGANKIISTEAYFGYLIGCIRSQMAYNLSDPLEVTLVIKISRINFS